MNIPYAFYLGIILASLICGLLRIKRIDTASKYIIILLACTLVSEYLASLFTRKYNNNMPVYHVYAPVQLFIVCLYFNYSIGKFRQRHIGWYIGVASCIISILNTVFIQHMDTLNSHYLLFTGFVIISMSMYAFYEILENDDIGVPNNPHFWFSFILLFFWSTTYVTWALYRILSKRMFELAFYVGNILLNISTLMYLGFGLVFIFYPKNIKKIGR